MSRSVVVSLMCGGLVGCSFKGGGEAVIDAAPNTIDGVVITDDGLFDAMVDGPPIDESAADTCRGSGNFRVCVPTMSIVGGLGVPGGGLVIDTDNDAMCDAVTQAGPVAVCVVLGSSAVIDGKLEAYGTRPLVVFALGGITINATGSIDVASRRGNATMLGAGSNLGCAARVDGGDDGGGADGGTGGSFGTEGGSGGGGNNTLAIAPNAAAIASQLRGGCDGGDGGDGGGNGGPRGPGGGAVYLIAGGAILVDGAIDASGSSAGSGQSSNGGGGGGGAGGLIAFHAVSLTVNGNGKVFANGGGGGGGADTNSGGGAGNSPSLPDMVAGGGTAGGAMAGAGGDGAIGATKGENGASNSRGGGGGGGGVGVIRLIAGTPTITGKVSPPIL